MGLRQRTMVNRLESFFFRECVLQDVFRERPVAYTPLEVAQERTMILEQCLDGRRRSLNIHQVNHIRLDFD